MHNYFALAVPRKVPISQMTKPSQCNSKNFKVRSDIARGPLNQLVRSYGRNPHAILGKVRVYLDLNKLN